LRKEDEFVIGEVERFEGVELAEDLRDDAREVVGGEMEMAEVREVN